MIKVLNVISDTNIGGAGKCIINFCRNYDKKKFEIVVVLPKGSKLIEELKPTKVKLIEIDGLKDKSWDFASLFKLVKVIKTEKPDIVHTHASSTARLAARIAGGAKVVFTRHSVFPVSEKIKKGIGRFVYKTSNEFLADRMIAVADAAKENLTDGGIEPEMVDVILNGVEKIKETSDSERQKLKSQLGIKKDEYVIGILARLEEVKGHETFIEAANILINEKKMNAKFLILGTGTEEERLKEKVKEMQLGDKIIFTGFIKNVQDYINIFDIQVNCSFGTEATSLALLEGMSIGVPAVVTDFGGNPGVIKEGENGYIVPIKSPNDTANAIEKILTNKDIWEQMKKRSREIFEEKFTVQVYTKNIEKFYEKLKGEPKIKRINWLDIIIILVLLIVAIAGYSYLKRDNVDISPNTEKVVYQIRTNECLANVYDYIEEGSVLRDSIKNYNIGTIVAKDYEKSKRYSVSQDTREIVETELEDKIDIILTVEANATVTDKKISVGEYPLKVGNEAYIKGKGYAAGGYIISIER
ncbi:MAG: DUF4330 family protein [Clostridia bacterium]|nr:DUF4330 family protein [Clostridia bacterium]